jgi:hypothetical protein
MICSNCGQPLDEGKLFCGNCGHLNSNSNQTKISNVKSFSLFDIYTFGIAVLILISLNQLGYIWLYGNTLGLDEKVLDFVFTPVVSFLLLLVCVFFTLALGKKISGKPFNIIGIGLIMLGYILLFIAQSFLPYILGIFLVYAGATIAAGTILHREKQNTVLSIFAGIGVGILLKFALQMVNYWISFSFGTQFVFFITIFIILFLGIISSVNFVSFENIIDKQNGKNNNGLLKIVAATGLFFSVWIMGFLLGLLR